MEDRFLGKPLYDRVRGHTPLHVNERIQRETEGNIAHYLRLGPDEIARRIAELDREWDIDRALMANFAILGGSVFTAGVQGRPGWLNLFRAQIVFLLMHATVGWCPPVSAFRRLGFRTKSEIEYEKQELLKRLSQLTEEGPAQEVA